MQKPGFLQHPIEQDDITIPRSLFYLSVSSTFVSFILFVVSLCDLGYCSLWITPPACVFTVIYFTGVWILSRTERTEADPTYFPTVVFIGYILTLLWLVAFILTIVSFAVYPHMVDALKYHGLHSVTVGLQRFECFLCIVDLGLVGWFTARAHVIAMEEGNPDHWRIVVEGRKNPVVTHQIRVQGPVNLNDPSNIMEPRAAPPSPPPVPPDWVTAAVLEDNVQPVRRAPKSCPPQIEISPPDDHYDDEDEYISDYYEGQDQLEEEVSHFDAEDLYRHRHGEARNSLPTLIRSTTTQILQKHRTDGLTRKRWKKKSILTHRDNNLRANGCSLHSFHSTIGDLFQIYL
ncbi:hypothetical protein D9757_001339 [Collybiopsis confluens]|uniref:Uncharacterized protein n=1 Tax=Collybiopsis confluens TaxID=2823264 RepID=A0A8H5MGI3_9AGAR|nr:hypothetical protein D9757_001339 [Collybiopsis confluens]